MKHTEPAYDGSTLGKAIAYELRLRIIRGIILPGEILSENRIAADYGASRSPVREAFKTLSAEGLITLQRMGAVVNGLQLKDIHELYDVRHLIESFAWQRLAGRDPEAYVMKLEQIVDKMELAGKHQDPAAFALQDLLFHEVMITAAEHDRILHLWRSIREVVMAVMLITTESILIQGEHRIHEVLAKHRKLIESFKTGNSAVISQEISSYFEDSHLTLERSIG